jgi:hypothetical protein
VVSWGLAYYFFGALRDISTALTPARVMKSG